MGEHLFVMQKVLVSIPVLQKERKIQMLLETSIPRLSLRISRTGAAGYHGNKRAEGE